MLKRNILTAGISRRSKHFLNELGSLAVYEKVAFRVYSAEFRVLIVSLLPAGAVDPLARAMTPLLKFMDCDRAECR